MDQAIQFNNDNIYVLVFHTPVYKSSSAIYYADVDFAFEVSFKKAHTRSNYSDGDSTLSVAIRPLTYFLNKN